MNKRKKENKEKKDIGVKKLSKKVRECMILFGISPEDLAKSMDCCVRTLAQRLAHPETFTLKELNKLAERIHTPIWDLVQIGYEKEEIKDEEDEK